MGRLITPEAIVSYPHLAVPQAGPGGGEPKYSVVLVFPEGSDLRPLQKAVLEAAEAQWPGKAQSMIKAGKLRLPFRDDWEEKGYPENSTFISPKSKEKPGLVSRYAGPEGKPLPIEADELYAGSRARASIRAFAYDVNGNRGVSFALNNIQKLADGERLDGRVRAENEFDALEDLGTQDDPFGEGDGAAESGGDDMAALFGG